MFTIDAAQRDQIETACRNVPMSEQAINAIVIDEADIIAAATTLKALNSAGPDGIPSVFLKNCISLLTDPLGRIFRLSLASGQFPTLWKDAYMFPVHKSIKKETDAMLITIVVFRRCVPRRNCSSCLSLILCSFIVRTTSVLISMDSFRSVLQPRTSCSSPLL